MNKFKGLNLLAFMLSFCCILMLTGCQDKNEIESLAFVVALGVDMDESDNFAVSLQIIRRGTTMEKNQNPQTLVYASNGKTINEAINNISEQLSKEIKFSNEKCIIIGEKLAEYGIQSVIDFSLRENDIRPVVPILVTRGKAVDILKVRTKENSVPGYEIGDMVKIQRDLGLAAVATNLDFEKNKNVEESVNSCSVISKKDTTNNESENDLVISGSAVFKNYKLVGYMKEKETRGMNWLKGKIKYGNISIQFQDEDKVNLSILSCRSNLEASIVSNEVYIDVNVREKSNINEIDEKILGNLDFNSNPHILDYLSKKQDEFIYNEIMSAVNMSKNTFSADIFGFGDLLYKEHPKEWNKVKENWNENFKDVHINVNVSSQINQTGILSKSIDY